MAREARVEMPAELVDNVLYRLIKEEAIHELTFALRIRNVPERALRGEERRSPRGHQREGQS